MYERDGSDDHGECPNYEPVDEVVGYSFREMLKEKGKFDSFKLPSPAPTSPDKWSRTANNFRWT